MRPTLVAIVVMLAVALVAGCGGSDSARGPLTPVLTTPPGGYPLEGELPGGQIVPVSPAAMPVAKPRRTSLPEAEPPPVAVAGVAEPGAEAPGKSPAASAFARQATADRSAAGSGAPSVGEPSPALAAELAMSSPPGTATGRPVADSRAGSADIVSPRLVDAVLAEVNGEVITREDILGPLRPQMAEWRRQMSAEAFDDRCRYFVDLRLRQAISERLVLQEAKSSLTDPEKEELEARLDQSEKDMASEAGSRHALDAKLKSQGSSVAQERGKERDRLLIQRLLRQKVAPDIQVTHSDLLNRYNQVRAERYEQPERVHLALILIQKGDSAGEDQARALARAVHQRAASGEDFAKLAAQFSHDPMAAKGGDWGLVTRGAFRIKEVDDALFALKGGEVGPLIETPQVFYIIKALQRQDARTVPFTEVQAKLEDEVRQAKFNEAVSKYIQQLYERSFVRVMMENL